MRVKFLTDILQWNTGDVDEVPDEMAEEMIDLGRATPAKPGEVSEKRAVETPKPAKKAKP